MSFRDLIWRNIAVAIVYFVAGRCALSMAIPPGYATAIWPAAGLALLGVLLWGPRVGPGILLGSFAVNLVATWNPDSGNTMLLSAITPLSLGIGASAQALVGGWLIRRFVGFPTALEQERDVLLFLSLGAPIACITSASMGVTTLWLGGVVASGNLVYSWLTWWVGDTIGVLIFTPLGLLFVGEPRDAWRRRRFIVGLPLLVGFTAATLLFIRASQWELARLHSEFDRRAGSLAQLLEIQLLEYQNAILFVASLFESVPQLSRGEFNAFVSNTLRRYDGILALEWCPRIAAAQREAFEHTARADGLTSFSIREKDARGQWTSAKQRAEYVPVYYMEPTTAAIRPVIGYDISSEPTRRRALERARLSGRSSVTSKIDLALNSDDREGFLLASPAFISDPAPGVPETQRTVRGYAIGVFLISAVQRAAFRQENLDGLALELINVSEPTAEPLFKSPAAKAPSAHRDWHQWSRRFEFAGQRWEFSAQPTAEYLAAERSWQAWMVLAAGLSFTSLLGAFLLITAGRTERIESLVRERTKELQERTCELQQVNSDLADTHTQLLHSDTQVRASLREKEVLLKEIHHRVKNNLQVISGLINLQMLSLDQGRNYEGLKECQARVQAIALIHEKLYQSKDFSRIQFAEYTDSLATEVYLAAGISHNEVKLELAVSDIDLPIEKAVPCGLILNELIVNALKHAYPGGRRGTIRVCIRRAEARNVELVVEDDGIGLRPQFDPETASSLGMQLICALTEQLEGTLEVESCQPGTRIRVCFPLPDEQLVPM